MNHQSLPLYSNIRAFPSVRGNAAWSKALREILLKEDFDSYALELPEGSQSLIQMGVEKLPELSLVLFQEQDELAYIPIDPCDSIIEVIRQVAYDKIEFILPEFIPHFEESPWLPDSNVIKSISTHEYQALCTPVFRKINDYSISPELAKEALYQFDRLRAISQKHDNVLWVGYPRTYDLLLRCFENVSFIQTLEKLAKQNQTPQYSPKLTWHLINSDQSYFALGELPFYSGIIEKNRLDPFAEIPDLPELIKELWIQTRWQFLEGESEHRKVPTAKIQRALQYLRNLAWVDGQLSPGLMDIVEAAKGVFGDTFAAKVLEAAKYYPFFDPMSEDSKIELRPNGLIHPIYKEDKKARNIFRDTTLQWRQIELRPEPPKEKKKNWRYSWDPSQMCSHLPEDHKIEQFNQAVRSAAMRTLNEELTKSEPFSSSMKDGLDIRATLRNWHSGDIYVKEIPPKQGELDTVVILFDQHNDDKYPHRTVWFAEHNEESTLTFYSTAPFKDMIGPGIAQAKYGGLSLLFPPKWTPDPFQDPNITSQCTNLAEVLVVNALRHSAEKNICVLSAKPPTLAMKKWAQKFEKRIIHLPLSRFSLETLERLQKFHILNGKEIRSYARRFIGE